MLRFEGIKCTLKKELYIDYLERHKHCSVTDGQNKTVKFDFDLKEEMTAVGAESKSYRRATEIKQESKVGEM